MKKSSTAQAFSRSAISPDKRVVRVGVIPGQKRWFITGRMPHKGTIGMVLSHEAMANIVGMIRDFEQDQDIRKMIEENKVTPWKRIKIRRSPPSAAFKRAEGNGK